MEKLFISIDFSFYLFSHLTFPLLSKKKENFPSSSFPYLYIQPLFLQIRSNARCLDVIGNIHEKLILHYLSFDGDTVYDFFHVDHRSGVGPDGLLTFLALMMGSH